MFYPQTTLQLYNNLTVGHIARTNSTKVVKTKAQPKELLYFGRNLSFKYWSIWKKWWAHSYSHNTRHDCLASIAAPHLATLLSLSLGEPLILSIYLGFAMNIFVVVSLNLQVLWIFFPLNLFCNSRVSVWAWKSCCFFNSFLKKYSAFAINPLHGFQCSFSSNTYLNFIQPMFFILDNQFWVYKI